MTCARGASGLRGRLALARAARRGPVRRVHVVGVARPEHLRTVARLRRELARSRHDVALHLVAPAPGAGKWANINAALAAAPPADADWLLIVDDDVVLPRGFLDRFLARRRGVRARARPARARVRLARRVGRHPPPPGRARPPHALRRDRPGDRALGDGAAAELLPFPDLRMGWGLDAAWSALAAERGWPIGVIDATPIRHLRPVASSYPRDAAIAEAEAFLDGRAYVTRDEAAETLAEYRSAVRVAVVAEYYPRAADPALGVWAHRQALAARDAGAEVEVLVLHRPVPSKAALRSRDPPRCSRRCASRCGRELDGIGVTYVPFVAPPRPRSYASWGAWAAPSLALALRALRRRFAFDLVHAHYAAPAGDAVRRARIGVPLVISVHGGDVLGVAEHWRGGRAAVESAFGAARLTLANSARDRGAQPRARRARRARRAPRHRPARRRRAPTPRRSSRSAT